MNLTPKDLYCYSYFTARVHVNGVQDAEDQYKKVYLVNIEHTYKDDPVIRAGFDDGKLYTMKYTSLCEVNLEVNKRYCHWVFRKWKAYNW